MKNKSLIFGLIAVAIVVGIALIAKPFAAKKPAKKGAPAPTVKMEKKAAQIPAKKAISKDKGGLTVRIVDSKNKEMPLRIRAFKSITAKSSVYLTSLAANKMQEVLPGTYDIEIDTIPQTIYKNISVVRGKEKILDLGSITGSINIKALNAKKTTASYPVKILHSKSKDMVAGTTSDRPVEVFPGVYDVEIGTIPVQVRKEIKVDPGKEAISDLGCTTGTLLVKALDENKKEVRLGLRITKSENNELVTSTATNRPLEILQGVYNVEISSTPKQDRKDVKVNAGEDTLIEFLVQAPAVPPKPVPPKAPTPAKRVAR
ncbi:MAG: hypothetical protein HZC19_02255 [Candidatus Omnitrophica bacterium]|nr:hypothetical protein [Candidatus Omnitrophota bacterium]